MMPMEPNFQVSFLNITVVYALDWFDRSWLWCVLPFPPRVQWSQFKNYFLFKLEKVMDDFRASAPEQRGPANPNVESIPFEDMKERILKIVKGYNG